MADSTPVCCPRPHPPAQTQAQLQALAQQLAAKDAELAANKGRLREVKAELQRLREEIAQAKVANAAQPDTHDYSEAETRGYFIDLLLKEAGWTLPSTPRPSSGSPALVSTALGSAPLTEQEFPIQGMSNKSGTGFVDYVLWGNDGKPLALVEAKRTRRALQMGQQQAKLYADLEQQFGQRPVIFYTNGYQHWLWDEANYPSRPVQGFFKKDELELMIQRRSTRWSLVTADVNHTIVER